MTANRPDDLLSALGGPRGPDVRLYQGVLTAWDRATGENVVVLAGTRELLDLPVVGAHDLLDAGDVVSVVRWGSRYMILGSLAVPPNVHGREWQAPTLLNGWDEQHPLGYRIGAGNRVEWRGEPDGSSATDSTVLTLPAAYRPAQACRAVLKLNNSGSDVCLWQVSTGGTVSVVQPTVHGSASAAALRGLEGWSYSLDPAPGA